MADNGSQVKDLVVAVVKLDELKESAGGKPYLRFNCVNNDTEEPVFFSGVAFGVLAVALGKRLKPGNKMKVSGTVSQKEYISKKTEKPGVENKLTVNSVKLSDGKTVVTLDEFTE